MLTSGTNKGTGVAGSPKALPYWLGVTLRKLVDYDCHYCLKGSSSFTKKFVLNPIQ